MPLKAKHNSSHDESHDTYVAHALNAKGGGGRIDGESETFVAHALRADGFDASEDGTGRGTPLVFDTTQITSRENRCRPEPGDPSHPLPAHGHAPAIAYQCHGTNVGEMGTLRKGDGGVTSGVPFVSFNWQGGGDQTSLGYDPEAQITGVLQADQTPAIAGAAVRRLTPRECERLQGFPDDYTAIAYRGKLAADGPRYKALGNSMAVPVMRWILSRIAHLSNSSTCASRISPATKRE